MASCLRGAFPPVDLRGIQGAVCFVRAILENDSEIPVTDYWELHLQIDLYLAGLFPIGSKLRDLIG